MRSGLALALGPVLMVGCSHVTDRVILLPQPDGSPSALVVGHQGRSVRLDQPYQEAVISDRDLAVGQSDAAQVRERYAQVLAAQPRRPLRFEVRFEANGRQLTADSAEVIARMLQALRDFPAPEVIVTGHTDTVGAAEVNDRLSLERAQVVSELITTAGVPREAILAVGRGEREPLVASGDGVDEPRNRRVEIKIR